MAHARVHAEVDAASTTAQPVLETPSRPRRFFDEFEPGRFVELSGRGCSAQTSVALETVRRAQDEGDTTAWIQPAGGPLFPPDAEARGIDLRALTVILVPLSELPYGPCSAAETLLRSGGFGLVVLDLRAHTPPLHDQAWQSRLCGFARKHHCRLVALTARAPEAQSLGPMVSLRVHLTRRRVPSPVAGPGRFEVDLAVLKNKLGRHFEPTPEVFRGPWGLGR